MSFISAFDVMGPNMIGPSSSHTAGAARISYLAQKMIEGPLKRADFILYGSFAKTYRGHGTDRALLGGIMGFSTDDMRIRNSFDIAHEKGLEFSFTPNEQETDIHPNTVDICMENEKGQKMTVRGESLGGGKVRIVEINHVQVDFTGEYSAVIVIHQDTPGVVAYITKCLSDRNINIAFMRLFREGKGDIAYTIVESDGKLPENIVPAIRENPLGETASEIVNKKMTRVLEIMKDAAFSPIKQPVKSMGGLIGGEARKLSLHAQNNEGLCGDLLQKAITYAMATLETNASMGLIVASPTAGSAGIVPGLMLAMQEHYQFSDEKIIQALFNASAIGYLAMRNATVAGAVGGCQAEVGVASAMAASAAVELMGGTPRECTFAASTVLMNMLGLVCDPVGGLVEYPCQNRNAAGVANAIIAAEMALAGIPQLIPLDEMIQTMFTVGKKLPAELRETAMGGCASTPSACEACHMCS